MRVRSISAIVAALFVCAPQAFGQFRLPGWRNMNDPVYRRAVRDLRGQSYTDNGPRGRGYYTPMFLPGYDDFNGPSRAYMPIYNAPAAAPRDSFLQPEQQFGLPQPAGRATGRRPGLLGRVFGGRQ